MFIEKIEINATTSQISSTSDETTIAQIDVPFFLFFMIAIIIFLSFIIIFRNKKNVAWSINFSSFRVLTFHCIAWCNFWFYLENDFEVEVRSPLTLKNKNKKNYEKKIFISCRPSNGIDGVYSFGDIGICRDSWCYNHAVNDHGCHHRYYGIAGDNDFHDLLAIHFGYRRDHRPNRLV